MKRFNVFPFGGWLKPDEFDRLDAESVLTLETMELHDKVAGKLVFVGSNWHQLGWKTGPLSDSHLTPIGPLPGVFVHANYAEAILAEDYYWPAPEWVAYVLEIGVLLAMALLLALEMNPLKTLTIVIVSSLLFIAAGYILLQNLGIYFDFFIPLIFLLLHFSADRILEWRRIALGAK
jgi:CHASE2 domain-containing sensor protein